MRTFLIFALLPLAFAGPVAQDRWGFGLLESLLAGPSSSSSTTTSATAGETTTKSGIFGLGLLPNNGGLLGFGLLGGNSETKNLEDDSLDFIFRLNSHFLVKFNFLIYTAKFVCRLKMYKYIYASFLSWT